MSSNNWFSENLAENGIGTSFQVKALVHQEQTPIMNIEIYDTTHFGYLMVIDGNMMLNTRENFLYHEMMTHPILFSHPNPQNVVIIGGGDCGALKEVLKHPVSQVTQVEIEKRVTQLAEEYFPELCSANDDPRAQLLFEDGIAWMKAAPSNSVDVIIVDSTDPIGPAEGLFNAAFYQQCYRVLKEDGFLGLQSESPFIHEKLLKDIHHYLAQADFAHRLTIPFPTPIYPTGAISTTLASKKVPFAQFRRAPELTARMALKYYQSSLHEAVLTPPPFLTAALKGA